MIMQGFVGFRIPIWVRRLVTMLPAFGVVALDVDATKALVISQVVLSITLPLPMIALLLFTRRPDLMGRFANRWPTDPSRGRHRRPHCADAQRVSDR
jgi:manganese transport protein